MTSRKQTPNIVSKEPTLENNRGQFILAGTVVLIILLITAVAVGNIAISSNTERQAGTEDYSYSIEHAVSIADQSIESTLMHVNHDPEINTEGERQDQAIKETNNAIEAVDRSLDFRGDSVTGEIIEVDGSDTIDGYRITQNSENELTSESGDSDWTITSDADTTRQFTLALNISSFDESSDPITFQLDGEPVTIDVQDTDVTLEANGDTCTVEEDDTATIDLLTGTVNDKTCGGYPEFETVSDITVENGDVIDGTYSVVILGDETNAGEDVSDSNTAPESGSADNPVGHHAIYAIIVESTVATDKGTTTRPLIVAPGGIDDPLEPIE